MLLRLKVGNFLSFYEENEFDMFPNPRRATFLNHVYTKLQIPLLKQAALYGANGSGKSNVLSAMAFLKAFASDKNYAKTYPYRLYKFRLTESNQEPIRFTVEFLSEDTYFVYNVAINDTGIENEELLISGLGERDDECLYRRCGNRFTTMKTIGEELQQTIDRMLDKNPFSSFLALNQEFPVIDDSRVNAAFSWFSDKVHILSLHRILPELIGLMAHRPQFASYVNRIISNIGLGIDSIHIRTDKLIDFLAETNEDPEEMKKIFKDLNEEVTVSRRLNDRILYAFEREKEEVVVKRLVFKQLGIHNYPGELEYERQSDGTVRLMNLMPALYHIKYGPHVYFIDEPEIGIHPTLIFQLLKFFAQEETQGQLIYTTHEAALLDQRELMRPDEVWFVEKRNGQSRLYSLNDFKEHDMTHVVDGYLKGRYGAVPFIGNLTEQEENDNEA